MLKKVRGKLGEAVEWVKGKGRSIVGAAAVAVGSAQMYAMEVVYAAEGSVEIPDVGVDWTVIATEAGKVVGAIVVGLVGLKIAISLVMMGVKFLGRMLA